MCNGSKILFSLALVNCGVGLLGAASLIGRLGPQNDLHSRWLEVLSVLAGALSWAVFPLLGAIAVHRLDRWLAAARAPAEGAD
jgi:drug/metabolite transporter (DMT)-like permease